MTVFNAAGPFLRLSYSLLAAGLSRLLHEIEKDKAACTNFIKRKQQNGIKAQNNQDQTKA